MKTVRLQNTVNSADMLTLKIYHTSITGSNLLTSSISSSGIFTGQDLFDGLTFQVEDEVSQFFIENLSLCTNIGSGSLTENSNVIEFLTFGAGGNGSLEIVGSQTRTTTSTITVRQNYSVNPTITITASGNYPYVFDEWYSNSAYTGSVVSDDNPLTLASGSKQGLTTFYAKWRLAGS